MDFVFFTCIDALSYITNAIFIKVTNFTFILIVIILVVAGLVGYCIAYAIDEITVNISLIWLIIMIDGIPSCGQYFAFM